MGYTLFPGNMEINLGAGIHFYSFVLADLDMFGIGSYGSLGPGISVQAFFPMGPVWLKTGFHAAFDFLTILNDTQSALASNPQIDENSIMYSSWIIAPSIGIAF